MKKKTKTGNKIKNRLFIPIGFVLFLSLWLLSSWGWAYERVDLLDSQAFIIRVSHVPGFLKAIEQSPAGRMWNSEQMKPFLNNGSLGEAVKDTLLNSFGEKRAASKELTHLLWEELKMLKGELVIGISYGKEGEVNYTMVADMDKADFLKSIEMEERMAELNDDLSPPMRQTFQGVNLFRTVEKSEGKSETEWQAFYGGTMIGSNSREWVERSIVRLKKELPSSPSGAPALHFRLNHRFIESIFESGTKIPPADEPGPDPPISPVDMLNALGLDALQHISLDVILKPNAAELLLNLKHTRPAVHAGEKAGAGGIPGSGLWALFCTEPLPAKHHLVYVPEDVYFYQVMRLDFNALWKEVPKILSSIDPRLVLQFQGFMSMVNGMYQVDLSRDLFENLGTLITTFSRAEGMMKQELYAWQLRNPVAIEKLLAKFFGEGTALGMQFQGLLEIHELQGHKLYSIKIQPKRLEAPDQRRIPGQEPAYLGFSVVDGALVIGAEKMVRGLIQAASTSNKKISDFYSSPLYTSLMQRVPEDAVGYGITDISRVMKILVTFFKNTAVIKGIERERRRHTAAKAKPSPLMQFFNNLQFDRLPSADFMASFFGRAVSYTQFKDGNITGRTIIQYPGKR